MSTEVLRFAPSPTGGFHVGNARTAIFNHLFAKRYDATLLLRIEDTDRDRSSRASLDTILEGLAWLGIDFDGEPTHQTQNETAHVVAAETLIASGLAYRCYATADELESIRKQAQKDGVGARFPAASDEEATAMEAEGRRPVVYFRIPAGETTWDDPTRWKVGLLFDRLRGEPPKEAPLYRPRTIECAFAEYSADDADESDGDAPVTLRVYDVSFRGAGAAPGAAVGRRRFFFVGMTSLPALSRNVTKFDRIDRSSPGAPSSPPFSSSFTTSQPRCFFSSKVATRPEASMRSFCA